MFQFYISAIITRVLHYGCIAVTGFQFYISAIITREGTESMGDEKEVSILHKCDYNASVVEVVAVMVSGFNST